MSFKMFWDTFWSTLLADLIVGGVIAVIIQLILSFNEKRQIEFDERKRKELKAIGYMKSLQDEVKLILHVIGRYQTNVSVIKFLGIFTPLWDSFMLTGELPSVLSPLIFQNLSTFYARIYQIKNIVSRLFETELFKDEYLKNEFEKILRADITVIQIFVDEVKLVDKFPEYIELSEREVVKINTEIRKTNLIYRIQNIFNEKISNDINEKAPRFKEG